MIVCSRCKTQVQDGIRFCPNCGQDLFAQQQQQQQQGYQQPGYQQNYQQNYQQAPGAQQPGNAAQDAQANKTMAILAYIVFFVPLITGDHRKSPFVKYHVNQGLLLFIVNAAYSFLYIFLTSVVKVRHDYFGIVYYSTPGWLSVILYIPYLAIAGLCVMGILNAVNGKMKPLPVIGDKITIIK